MLDEEHWRYMATFHAKNAISHAQAGCWNLMAASLEQSLVRLDLADRVEQAKKADEEE